MCNPNFQKIVEGSVFQTLPDEDTRLSISVKSEVRERDGPRKVETVWKDKFHELSSPQRKNYHSREFRTTKSKSS